MLNTHCMPWYSELLGRHSTDYGFDRLITEFTLTSKERKNASTRWYENETQGISVVLKYSKIHAIQIFSPTNLFFPSSQRDLPLGLHFDMTRKGAHEHLGKPNHVTAKYDSSAGLGHSGIDRYHTPNCTLAITYAAHLDKIEVVGFELTKDVSE